MKFFTITFFIIMGLELHAQVSVNKVKIVEGFKSPESILVDGDSLFVSNVGAKLDPTGKDSDGFISRLTKDGEMLSMQYLPPKGEILNAPKGMTIVGTTLFVADVDRVVGFDLASKQKVFEMSFSAEGTLFLNDLVGISAQHIVVSATDISKLFLIKLGTTPTYQEIKTSIPLNGPNGVAWDGKTLTVVGFGRESKPNGQFYQMNFAMNQPVQTVEVVSNFSGYLDGVAIVDDKRMLVSDWTSFTENKGKILLINTKEKTSTPLSGLNDFAGPADFSYQNSVLYLPHMIENKISIRSLNQL
jgi:hypothetical protein